LDRELGQRGLRFVRYADDCNIYVRSRRAGERVMESITRFITVKLRLKVNDEKSAVAEPWARKFLGFSFTRFGEPRRRIAPKAILRFQGTNPGANATDARCEHGPDGRGAGSVSSGLARLFWEVSNAVGAGWTGSVAPAQAAVCDLEAVEARLGAVCRTATPRSGQRPRRANGGERSRSVATGAVPCAGHRTAQCLFRLAWDSEIDWQFLSLTRRTAVYGPVRTVV